MLFCKYVTTEAKSPTELSTTLEIITESTHWSQPQVSAQKLHFSAFRATSTPLHGASSESGEGASVAQLTQLQPLNNLRIVGELYNSSEC